MKKILTILIFFISLYSYTQTHELADEYWAKAKIAEEKEDWENAAILFEKSAIAEKKSPSPRFGEVIVELYNAAMFYEKDKKFKKTIQIYNELLKTIEINFGKNHLEYGENLKNLASIYETIEEYEKAIPLYIEALENTNTTLGKEHPEYVISLNNLASLYKTMKFYEKALPLFLEAIKNKEKVLGKEHLEYGILINNLALLYTDMEFYEKALPLFLKALKIIEKNLGKEHSTYGSTLNNLAVLYQNMGEYKKAIPFYIKALKNTENTLGKEHSVYGNTLNNLAVLYQKMEEYNKALPLFLKAIEITENTLGKEHSVYGDRLSNLALLYQDMLKHNESLPLFLKAIEITANTLGKLHSEYGGRLNNLATSYYNMGEYNKALPLFIEALENKENAQGKGHPDYGTRLSNLGNLYNVMGRYNKALPFYIKALENTENTLGKEHSNYGRVLNGLGNLYEKMGIYNKALPLYIKALKNTENTLGKEHSRYGTYINNLASLYNIMGRYNKALPLYIEALENVENTLGKEHSLYGATLNNLGNLYRSMGLYEKAFPLFLEALKNTENTLGKEHSNYGLCLGNLAGFYQSIGEYKKALPLFLEALENVENTLGKDHSLYGTNLNNLMNLYGIMGLYEKVLPLLIKENKNTITQIKQNFSFQNEEGKEKFVENILGNGLNRFQQFNFTTNNSYSESLSLATNNILLGKGLLLDASKNILTKLEGLNDKSINEKIVLFKSKKAFVNQQLQLTINKRAQNYTTEKEDLETLERELVTLYTKNFNEEINYVKDWKKTQLKENELAIEFTHFDHYNKQWTDSTMYDAYLYKKDWKTPKVINLFEEKQLKKYFSISSNPNNLYKTRGTITKSNTAQLALADSIYKLVWKPLEKYVDASSTIYFSPDGLLHKIPFAALPNKNNKLIGEFYDIQQMGNTADVNTNTKQPNLNDVLLIGGVKYEYKIDSSKKKKEFTTSILESEELLGDTINRSISRNGFNYLKGTELEINKIDSLLGTSKQLSGYKATETAFKKLSGNSPSVLHIATHGFFFKKPKEKKKNAELSGEQNSYKVHENPLLRSGLLFANANYAWQNGNNPYEEDDGILTALEISNLDLKNTDIVILSACETGLGDIEGSEGVYGLQRAFKMAGVKTIIMSLWPVPDAETAEFMNLFYTKWKGYNNSKKAFKETQQQMMIKYRDEPQKWAAFVYFE